MTGSRPIIIAIDGPSGAGKGTIARTIASRLSYLHVDTGAMYRAVAWKALQAGLDLDDAAAVADLAARARLVVGGRVSIDDEDVTEAIRTPAIDRAAAVVAQHPAVREVLVARQRQYGAQGGVVMEGRDIGSVVFPEAEIKVYLDATPEERARRRALDAARASNRDAGLDLVAAELSARDQADSTRRHSPLQLAPGAVYIDTTGTPIETVVERVMTLVDGRLPTKPA